MKPKISNRKSHSPESYIHFSIQGDQPFPFAVDAIPSGRTELRHTMSADIERIEIPPDRWDRFWDELEKIGVWKWKSQYARKGIQGVSWELDILHGGRRLKTCGFGAYPESDDPNADPNYPPGGEFDRLIQAISRLVGIPVDQIGSEPSDYE